MVALMINQWIGGRGLDTEMGKPRSREEVTGEGFYLGLCLELHGLVQEPSWPLKWKWRD